MQDETTIDNERDTSLLDLLAVVSENLKLLVIGPIVAGLVALGITFVIPQTYTSEAILALPAVAASTLATPTATPTAQAAAMMVSPLVLDPVVQALNLSGGQSIQSARKKLQNQVKATVGKDGLLRLEASAETPKDAQVLANAILDTWLKSTVPGPDDRADLETRLARAKFSLENIDRMLKRLTLEGVSELNKPLTRGEVGASIVAISELETRYLNEVLSLPRLLKGYSRDVVKQAPTLPTEAVNTKKILIIALAAIMSAIFLLVWVLVKNTMSVDALKVTTSERKT
jgi:Chain length determinant protein